MECQNCFFVYPIIDSNLTNCPASPLISERKAVLDELTEELGKVDESELHNYCTELLEEFENEQDVKTPYAGVLIWYLESLAESSG